MRLASLALIGLVASTAPVHAASAAPAKGADIACVASVKGVEGSSGFKVVRECGKASASKKSVALQVARQPVKDGSNAAGEGGGVTVITSLLAFSAIVGVFVLGSDEEEKDLPISG